jgi:hypothetical protein
LTSKNEQLLKLKATVDSALGVGPTTLSIIEKFVVSFAPLVSPDLDDEDLQLAISEIELGRLIDMGDGIAITADSHEPWLDNRKHDIQWQRWEAYRSLLSSKSMPPKVLDAMNSRNEKVLDLAGDPEKQGNWSRRGLVIGDVQSGKTANYLALFNKAADAGYRVFILLAGNTDKLRQQTQARVDEGFIGRDTKKHQMGSAGVEHGVANKLGIGLIANIKTNNLTTYNSDFAAGISGTVVHLDQASAPTVFVIKKNKTILNNLTKWLKNSNPGGKVKAPVLLLDDEADYASINTNSSDRDATAINQGIRDLLNVFERNSYVGFTATPFANVLIDEQNEEDLFPRNFIYCLESPSNYFGPTAMFDEDYEGQNAFLEELNDGESAFPFKHKAGETITGLPESLEDAIRVFFLTNAIRDLRQNQETKPRSMLVNVSRFVRVQHQIYELIGDFVSETRDSLKYEKKSSSSEWAKMSAAFERHFIDVPEAWEVVRDTLVSSIEDVVVHVVNSKNKSDAWESIYDGPRARIIAVGGDVLSRGLTLEGLSTSYFYRRSLAYDTLMQMGRWFGYRDGYRDLCRLWIDKEVALWYRDISDAIVELKSDLAEMASRKLEPSQFGLAVRCHPGSMLMVTARNKALRSEVQPKDINVRDISTETSRLASGAAIESNWNSMLNLIEEIKKVSGEPVRKGTAGRATWTSVPQGVVGSFLLAYVAAEAQLLFAEKTLANFIASNTAASLEKWDVVVMSGEANPNPLILGGLKPVERSISIGPDKTTLYVGGKNQRLGGSADLGITLDDLGRAEIARIKNETGKSQVSADKYRSLLKRPLMTIYPLVSKLDSKLEGLADGWPSYKPKDSDEVLVGVCVAFPRGSSDQKASIIRYQVNSVWTKLNTITQITLDAQQDGQGVEELDEEAA